MKVKNKMVLANFIRNDRLDLRAYVTYLLTFNDVTIKTNGLKKSKAVQK